MKKTNSVYRWIFLSLAIFFNSFVLLYSTLSPKVTDGWTSSVTDFFASIINSFTEKEIKIIPITSLDVHMVSIDKDGYNEIPGYLINQIPIGSAKSIDCSFLPENTTDSSVYYYTDKPDCVSLSQSGNKVSVIGLKKETVTIYGKNNATGITASCEVEIVDTVAPKNFDISLSNYEIEIGSQGTIVFDIDGGVLGHNELINSRYYDIRRLSFASSNESVATIDNYGVIKPLSVGNSTISVSNGEINKTIDITIVDGNPIPEYLDLHIGGPNICYENDMIGDQTSGKKNYQLEIYDGEEKLNPDDFIWTSSDELLVRVDSHGKIRGFRKSVLEDETVTIAAISKITGQSVSYEVIVREQQLESIYYSVNIGSKTSWNVDSVTACVGDDINVVFGYTPSVSNKSMTVETSKDDILEITNQGSNIVLRVLKTGSCDVIITSVANPTLSFKISFTLLKAGAIATDDFADVGHSLRKVIGHAFLFAVAQIFTLLAIVSFVIKNEIWKNATLSLGIGLLVAIISEIIQFFNPGRSGAFLDILIDFSGVVIGALIVLITFINSDIHKKKLATKDSVDKAEKESIDG